MRIRAGSLALVSVLLSAAVSEAQVPRLLGYQGRLLRADGSAATGTASVAFSVWDAATAGSQLWSESQTLGLSDGYYATFLGIVTPPADSLFAGGSRWLEVRVGSETLAPRQQIGAVPWAMSSQTAQSVSGGSASVTSLQVGGQTVVDSAGRLAGSARYAAGPGVQIDPVSQTISLAACPDGQVLRRDGATWACAIPNAGSVTGVGASAPLSVSGSSSTPQISILRAGAGFDGYLSSADWTRFGGKYDGTTTCGGDLSGTLAAPVVARLQSRSVSPAVPADAQVLKWSSLSSEWAPATDATTPVVARAPLTAEGTSTAGYLLSMQAADRDRDGYLATSDFARFDGKFDAATECTGDLSGYLPGPTVIALQSRPVSADEPGQGQVLAWNGASWAPATLSTSDVSGLADEYLALEGEQTVGGVKNFTTPPTFDSPLATSSGGTGATEFTTGGVVFGGGDGALSQDERLAWDAANGRLGVGTSTPEAALEVHDGSQFAGLRVKNTDGTSADRWATLDLLDADGSSFLELGLIGKGGRSGAGDDAWNSAYVDANGRDLVLATQSENAIRFFTLSGAASSERLRIAPDGKVGIGTTAPASALDVSGAVHAGGTVDASGGLLTGGALRVDASGAMTNVTADTGMLTSGTLGTARGGTGRTSFSSGGIVFGASDGALAQSGSQLFWDRSNGRLGVGTSAPSQALHVVGGVNMRPSSGGSSLLVSWPDSTANLRMLDSAGNETVNVNSAGPTYFNGGRVGIGTTSPGQPLEVVGVGLAQRWRALDSGGNTVLELAGQTDSSFVEAFAAADRDVKKPLNLNPWGGSVGIGTTSPASKLDVRGTARFQFYNGENVQLGPATSSPDYGAVLYLTNDIGQTQGATRLRATYAGAGTAAKPNFAIDRSTNDQAYGADPSALTYVNSLVIDGGTGAVGIGTTTPIGRLQVKSDTNAGSLVVSGTGGAAVNLYNPSGFVSINSGGVAGTTISDTSGEVLRVEAGKVGIGTTSPSGKLHVTGTDPLVAYLGDTSVTQYDNIVFNTNSGNAQIWKAGTAYTGYGGASALNLYNSNGAIALHPGGTQNAMFLGTNGRVGIGTTSPAATLDDAGDLRVAGTIKGASGAVFDGAGVNYIHNGSFESSTGGWSLSGNTARLADGAVGTYGVSNSDAYSFLNQGGLNIPTNGGRTFTLSAYVKQSGGATILFYIYTGTGSDS